MVAEGRAARRRAAGCFFSRACRIAQITSLNRNSKLNRPTRAPNSILVTRRSNLPPRHFPEYRMKAVYEFEFD
jgi:hypothetical protein